MTFARNTVPPRDAFATDLRFLPPFVSLSPDALIAAAERVLAGRYSFFDLEDCDLGDPPQWNRDPLTHRVAATRRASAIDYRDERVVGNIKYLWEANRHLHLVTLAQAMRSPATRVMRSASARRSTPGSNNARWAADRTG